MTKEQAQQFTDAWIRSWNNHDLNAILSHYAEDVVFYSPFIQQLGFNESGMVSGREELGRYFSIGLERFPELQFKLHGFFTGNNTVVIHYTSVNGRGAAEVFELDHAGKATTVYCNYSDNA
jgi:ketosteroid isomerase-like protein